MKFDFFDTQGNVVVTREIIPFKVITIPGIPPVGGEVPVFPDIAILELQRTGQRRYFLLTPGGYGPSKYVETKMVETLVEAVL